MAKIVKQEYRLTRVDELRPHPLNPRQGDVGAIVDSIETNDFYGVVLVQESTGLILAGHHRWMAARQQGLKVIPVLWADVDDQHAIRILLGDNRTSDLATWDGAGLAHVLGVLAEEPGGLAGTGFTVDDLDRLNSDLVEPLAFEPPPATCPGCGARLTCGPCDEATAN